MSQSARYARASQVGSSGTPVASQAAVFTKKRMATRSGFLDLALAPLRSGTLIRNFGFWWVPREASVIILRETIAGGVGEEMIFRGDPQAGPRRARAVIAKAERIMAEGLSLEAIPMLCERYSYGWRFHPAHRRRIRFVLEPATAQNSSPQP